MSNPDVVEQELEPLPMGDALRRGLRRAVGLWQATLLAFAARAVGALALTVAWSVFLLGNQGLTAGGLAFAGAIVFVGLGALVRGWVLGGALAQGEALIRGAKPEGLAQACAAQASRSVGYVLGSFLVEAIALSWRWLALIAGGWTFVLALVHRQGGFLGAAVLALALTLAVPLTLLATLWPEVAFARAVGRREGFWAGLYEAVALMRTRLWALLGLTLSTGAAAWVFEFSLSSMTGALATPGGGGPQWGPILAAQLSGSVLGAFGAALFEHARLQAVLAIDLERRPVPPREAGIPVAPVLNGAFAEIPVAPVVHSPVPSRDPEESSS